MRAIIVRVSMLCSLSLNLIGRYQHQPIDARVRLGVLCDVSIWHPRTYDAKREECLRNANDREYVGVRNGLAPTVEGLI